MSETTYTRRAQMVYEFLKDSKEGLTTSQLILFTRLSRIAPAIHELRKSLKGGKETIKTVQAKYKFLGLFPRNQAKYILERQNI